LSRFMLNLSLHHLRAEKRILRYVTRTMEFGIWYFKISKFKLCGFSDSN